MGAVYTNIMFCYYQIVPFYRTDNKFDYIIETYFPVVARRILRDQNYK